jgi:large subunit ribosomal protein L4
MAIKVNIYNQKAEKVSDTKLSEKVFGVATSSDLVHQAMLAQMGNERQVLAHTKTRSEVRGGGRKPWRQKGTGRARAGSSRSPIWIGGGVTFGPTNKRNFSKNINKKMRQKALMMVLSDKLTNEKLAVLDKIEISEFKTKSFAEIVKAFEANVLKTKEGESSKRSVLVINDEKDEKVKYSSNNLEGVKVINLNNVNILDLLKYRDLIITAPVAEKLEKQYS